MARARCRLAHPAGAGVIVKKRSYQRFSADIRAGACNLAGAILYACADYTAFIQNGIRTWGR